MIRIAKNNNVFSCMTLFFYNAVYFQHERTGDIYIVQMILF